MSSNKPGNTRYNCGRAIAFEEAANLEPGLDDTELAALDIMRFFFVSYAEPESQGWRVAFSYATSAFGRDRGARIAYALMETVEAMSRSRRSMFCFSNPRCPKCRLRLTEPEQRLMRILRASRRGDGAASQTQALILCEGNPTARFIASATLAARELDRIGGSESIDVNPIVVRPDRSAS